MNRKLNHVSTLDKVIRYVSPERYKLRQIARIQSEILTTRGYDAAQSNPQNSIKGNSNSASNEISSAVAPIRNNVRELVRNTPFAKKATEVIVNGVVGWGIQPSITHVDKVKEKKIRELWKEWSSGLCSIDGKTDFNSLQKEVMTAIVTDGEVLVQEVVLEGSIRLNILEADHICTLPIKDKLPDGQRYSNGIVQDKYGRAIKYNFYETHPGNKGPKPKASLVEAKTIDLIFRKDRPGQDRGISWFAPAVHSINMLSELQYTHLLKMKLASAITAFVKKNQSTLPPAALQGQRQAEWNVQPGDVFYMAPDEDVEFPTIPNTEGFEASTRLAIREQTAAVGITYEAGSNDNSQTNFSSYKAGDIQFRANVDHWRWHLLIPYFCRPSFERFKKYCAIKGVDTKGVECGWVPPIRQMIDPAGETNALNALVRNGFQSYPSAVRELGYDFDTHINEVEESNRILDEKKIILDCDPRRIGNQQLQSQPLLNSKPEYSGEGTK